MTRRGVVVPHVLVALFLAPLGGPAGVGADASQDAACGRVVGDALGIVALTDDQVTALTGCYPDGRGWFYQADGSDPGIPGGPLLTATERPKVADVRATINAQLADLRAFYPGWIGADLQRLQDEAIDEDGRLVPGFGVPWDATAATLYGYAAPITAQFLVDPDNYEVGVYAGWWFDQRIAAAPPSGGSPMMDQATSNVLQHDRLPWPWELGDPYNQDAFFAWALDRGVIA